ncbi:phospholipase [Hymenobacter sp. B81]|uniref:phospholipase n=1 Tax=Hymenobacter sp. B81 TaxID=3344878 RepID=UPI0037DCBAAF
MPPVHLFSTSRTARYMLLGEPGPAIQTVWFCLHDADQSVEDLAEQLRALEAPDRLLVLPEALSRYALAPTSPPQLARPAAAWLVPGSGDLLPDLLDLTAYLDELAASVLSQCPPQVPVTVLGCGQGAAAACRWLAGNRTEYQRLVLYAAVFPPDFDRRATFVGLPERPVTVVATTVDTLTPEASGQGLVQDLLDVGLTATLRHVTPGAVTLAALGPMEVPAGAAESTAASGASPVRPEHRP